MQLRFAVGEVPEEHREEIAQEEATYGSFLHIPLKVQNIIPRLTMHGPDMPVHCNVWGPERPSTKASEI